MSSPSTGLSGDGVSVRVHSGFPNPATSPGRQRGLSLDQLLIRHPSSTYLFRVSGNQWTEQGIFDGDIALIDRALIPQAHDLVVTWQNDTFALLPQQDLPPGEAPWGTITAIIHTFHSPNA